MNGTFRSIRGALWMLTLAGLLGLSGSCSNDDPATVVVSGANFTPSATPPAANRVRLTGAAIDDDTVRVNVVINGPTTSSDIYAYAFDLLLSNPPVASYIAGTAVAGDALQPDAAQGQTVTTQVAQQGARVVVGVSLTGGTTGHGLPAGQHTILSLDFDVHSGITGISMVGSPASGAPAALDSSNPPAVLPSVVFDTALSAIDK